MKQTHDPQKPAPAAAPKRRFRLERLEERIAPAKGGQTKGHNGGGNGGQSSGSSGTFDCGSY